MSEKRDGPPFDGKPCPACPQEVRNLYAVAHNFTHVLRGTSMSNDTTLEDLERAVADMQLLIEAHFEDKRHSHGPAIVKGKGQKVLIVFEQTDDKPIGQHRGEGTGFRVYLEGAEGATLKDTSKLTAPEFYGLRCFRIVGDVLRQCGALQSVEPKPDA